MSFDASNKNFIKLLARIAGGKDIVVPFIGAGLSIYGPKDKRSPTWLKLLEELLNEGCSNYLIDEDRESEIRLLIKEGKFTEAASQLSSSMGERLRVVLRDQIDGLATTRPIPQTILELALVAWRIIITTNFDTFIERAWGGKQKEALDVYTHRDAEDLFSIVNHRGTSQHALIKTHGDINKHSTIIFTQEEYDKLIENKMFADAMSVLYGRILLFVGYSLSDNDLLLTLESMRRVAPEKPGEFYAILTTDAAKSERIKSMVRKYGLSVIPYTVNDAERDAYDGGHAELHEAISLIIREWLAVHRPMEKEEIGFPMLDKNFQGRRRELEDISNIFSSKEQSIVQIIGLGGEGKTSLVQRWIQENEVNLTVRGFVKALSCSFYKEDPSRFVDFLAKNVCDDSGSGKSHSEKVDDIVKQFRNTPYLLIMDGMEVVQRKTGELQNEVLRRILGSCGRTKILLTSRIEIIDIESKVIPLKELSLSDSVAVLKKWDLPFAESELNQLVSKYIGQHALSLRIMAGYLKEKGIRNISVLEGIQGGDICDEGDALKTNKAYRVLKYYEEKILENNQLYAIRLFTLFRKGISRRGFKAVLAENDDLPQEKIEETLVTLETYRLIIEGDGGLLTCHPLVREYFSEHFSHNEKLNRFLCAYYENQKPSGLIDNLIEACYHAARAKQWEHFHQLFSVEINNKREFRLGYVFGDWESYLSLTRQVFENESTKNRPQIYPAYYFGTAAMALKRTGQSSQAVCSYFDAIHEYAEDDDGLETARQVNNLINLFISMGHLVFARRLLSLNVAVTNWIVEEPSRIWQLECAYGSIGKYLLRSGEIKGSLEYYREAEALRNLPDWKSRYDLQGLFHGDALLASALPERISLARSVCVNYHDKEDKWGDIRSIRHRLEASIIRADIDNTTEYAKRHQDAEHLIGMALDASDNLYQPEIQIDILLEKIKILLTLGGEYKTLTSLSDASYDDDLVRLKRLIEKTELYLYEPERLALVGQLALLRGKEADASANARDALKLAEEQKQYLLLCSSRYPLLPLMKMLKMACVAYPSELLANINMGNMEKEIFLEVILEIREDWERSEKTQPISAN